MQLGITAGGVEPHAPDKTATGGELGYQGAKAGDVFLLCFDVVHPGLIGR